MHIWFRRLTIIGPNNGLSPGWRQAISWTDAEILLIEPLETNFNETLIEVVLFSFTKMRLELSSAKWRPFCLGLNVLNRNLQSPQQGVLWNKQNNLSPIAWEFIL